MNQQQPDPYRILGVKRDASLDEIKRAFNSLALSLHPDTAAAAATSSSSSSSDKSNNNINNGSSNSSSNAERFAKVKEAFDILRDKAKRANYDKEYMHRGGRFGSEEGYGGYSNVDLTRRAAEFQRMHQQSFQQQYRGGEYTRGASTRGTWKNTHSRAMLSLETLLHPKSIAFVIIIPLIAWSFSALIVKEVAPSLSEYDKFSRINKDGSTTNRFNLPSWGNSPTDDNQQPSQDDSPSQNNKKTNKRILLR